MGAARRDRVTGLLLLAFAAAWVLAVWYTVPAGTSEIVGPRAFPLGLGIALGVLALVLLAASYVKPAGISTDDVEEDGAEGEALAGWLYLRLVLSLVLVIVAYGFLMEKVGFVLATLVTVAVMVGLILKIRNPLTIIGMAVGLAFGCWLLFGKILGAYLPPGTWISLF